MEDKDTQACPRPAQKKTADLKNPSGSGFTLPEVIKTFEQFEKDLTQIAPEKLESKYLGKKGVLSKLLRQISDKPADERPVYGKEVNELKTYAEEKIENIKTLDETLQVVTEIDITAPFDIDSQESKRPQLKSEIGHRNPLTSELKHVLRIFESMGFNVVDSRQLDDDYHVFESLNFPPGHPARDMWDTFWTDDDYIPVTHTSCMQNRIIKSNEPPIRYVIPGTCYRNEATDARHEHTLSHVEGVYIDEGVSLSNMIAIIKSFLEEYYRMELKAKIQPAYFPFVEPGMEFCMSCPFCGQSGCSTCGHKGWIEIFPCGMIHPNVIREGGLDPKKYSGFAWGFGLDRLIMLKTKIEDVRRIRGGEIEFLEQF
ncbi:phenylalanine--tRNA ligase subunit alpha [Candidatus Dojkabacteria bacterium]|nr:phenylalanine--tRNA ligase subunit alpha [Candidatus Dojkabacteria bacterium]